MLVAIEQITIPAERMRSARGVSELASSMDAVGQLQAIVVDEDLNLVSGLHRVESARHNGETHIEAEVRSFQSPLHRRLAEIDENLVRYELTALEKIEHVAERVRIFDQLGMKKGPGRPIKNPPDSGGFLTLAEIGESIGIGASTVRWYCAINERLSENLKDSIRGSRFENNLQEIERISKLDRMEKIAVAFTLDTEKDSGEQLVTGGVREIQRRMARAQTRRLGLQTESFTGRYRTIVIDPPWAPEITGDYQGPNGKIEPPYEHWPLQRIRKLPVAGWSEPGDTHLYLWVTTSTLPFGMDLLEEWGFEYHQTLTWVKDKAIPTRYYNHRTEHVLFATKGARQIGRTDVDDVIYGPPAQNLHSSKPESFFERVETCSPGPFLEVFARRARKGWSSWGSEVPRRQAGTRGVPSGSHQAI